MSQHDLNVANSTGAAVRADINNALQALATCSSGSTAPATTFAYQWWADTANDLLKQRNAANSAWISILKLSTGRALLASEASAGPGNTPFSFRNKLINGNFGINQRAYVSGSAVGAANTYTLDRWRVVTSGQNLAYSASGNGNAVTAPAGGIEQVIEGANIEGGIYTLSWVGAGTASVNGSAITNGGQTASLTAGANVTVKFVGAVSEAQFEIGSIATPFEQRPYGLELSLCQRYYQTRSASLYAAGYQFSAVLTVFNIDFPVEFRAVPTTSFSGAGSFGLFGPTFVSMYIAASSTKNMRVDVNTIGGTQGYSAGLINLTTSFINSSAEL